MEKARALEEQWPGARDAFHVPSYASLGLGDQPAAVRYLCGHSLGCMPRKTRASVEAELSAWSDRAVEAHFRHPNGTEWVNADLPLVPQMARMVGAGQHEVAVMGSLTANLNALLVAFYRPSGRRTKILLEQQVFPSDFHAFWNQAALHGLDPAATLVQVAPRPGEHTLRTEDIVAAIETHRAELALVCLPGVQYYTGQLLDMAAIVAAVRREPGVVVGFDLAHAVGNVPLQLHEWGADFACWCSYKYLNAGPGGIAGVFVHERHHGGTLPRLAGWWGTNAATRFAMRTEYDPLPDALGFRQSNPSVLDVAALRASLEVFESFGGMERVRARSVALTGYLYELLTQSTFYCPEVGGDGVGFTILTPADPAERGAQLSLLFWPHSDDPSVDTMTRVFVDLRQHGVLGDERHPDVIRLTPCALYNTFAEVFESVQLLNAALERVAL
ncbi:AaceriAGL098Wp [[Ashbya] aceris (nom. inval.)]|nr:AaceriAGL098Wp [[Ashbya] aceris (nom. inval.)]